MSPCHLRAELIRHGLIFGLVSLLSVALSAQPTEALEQVKLRVLDAEGAPISSAIAVTLKAPKDLNNKLRSPVLRQKQQRFMPRLVLAVKDQTLKIENNDSELHHIHCAHPQFPLNFSLQGGQSKTLSLKKIGRFRLLCNIHANMRATLIVLDSENFAIADAKGRLSLKLGVKAKLRVRVPIDDYKVSRVITIQKQETTLTWPRAQLKAPKPKVKKISPKQFYAAFEEAWKNSNRAAMQSLVTETFRRSGTRTWLRRRGGRQWAFQIEEQFRALAFPGKAAGGRAQERSRLAQLKALWQQLFAHSKTGKAQ